MSKVLQWMTTKMEEQGDVAKAVAGGDATSSAVAGAIVKMDPAAGFKLFGKTIAVAATAAAAACVLSDAGADAGALFLGMRADVHWATAPFCSQKNGIAGNSIAMGEEEDEHNLDELRSSSGSNNSGVVDDDSITPAVLNKTSKITTNNCVGGGLHGPSGAEPYTDSAGLLDDQGVVTQTTAAAEEAEEEEGEDDDDKLHLLRSKPEKIMACPRCDSLDTKFCYYNNYNINQPRHFCKNCQRYWTAGGTLRNVPVGAGRRKNKQNGAGIHGPTLQSSSSCEGETIVEPAGAAAAAAAAAHACQDSSLQIGLSGCDGTQEQTSSRHRISASTSLNIPQPKQQQQQHLAGLMQRENFSSPLLLSPGGSTDSCITINNNRSPPFSLSMSGSGAGDSSATIALHPFAATSIQMLRSSDSPTRLGQKQMIKAPPLSSSLLSFAAVNGAAAAAFGASQILSYDNETGGYPSKDGNVGGSSGSNSTLTGPLLMHTGTFTGPLPMHTVVKDGHVFQQLNPSSAVYHNHHHHQQQQQSMMLPPTGGLSAGWTSNGTPFSFFSGAWPPPYGCNNNGWSNGGGMGPTVPSSSLSTTMFGNATTTTTAGTGSLGGGSGYSPSAHKFAFWCPGAPPGTLTATTTLQAGGGHVHWLAAAAAAGAPEILGTHGGSLSGGVVSDSKGALDHVLNDDDDAAAAASFKASRGATTTSVSGTTVPWSAQGWRLKTLGPSGAASIGGGKRASPEGGKVEKNGWGSSKLTRVGDYNNNNNNNCTSWNNNTTVGIKSNLDVINNNNTANLFKAFQPKMEIQASATSSSSSSKHFYNVPHNMFINSLQFQETTTT